MEGVERAVALAATAEEVRTAEGRKNHRPSNVSSRRTALILYGSETGNAQDVAEETGRMTERLRFETTVLDMDSVQLREVVRPTVVLFAISTTGQGEMPQNARGFWKALLSKALRPNILSRLRFSSFGLGDSSYAQYNVAHRMLHKRLLDLGATSFCERGEGNELHPEGHSAGFREWIIDLKQQLLHKFPLSPGVEPIPDDVFIEPKWKLELSHVEESPLEQTVECQANGMSDLPSKGLMPVENAYTAYIESNDRITASNHFQDVRLLDLRVQESVPYGPGAVAVIWPKNFPEDVQSFIKLMGWEDIADKPLNLVRNTETTTTPSPLRHLDLRDVRLTLRWLLENVLDIMSIPRRSFFASLSHFTSPTHPDSPYQKLRLLELANPDLIDELWDYTTRPKRTILEVMMDFTTTTIPYHQALSVLPIMRGRQFSIASGGALQTDPTGRTRVELLIAIADPPSPIIKWRRRYGVCTRYIASLRPRQNLRIAIQPGYLDVQPSELQVPIIMIGPGTGLAPLRAMIHQRAEWARSAPPQHDILFFGCRSPRADFFFREEFETFPNLDVHVAFSRDPEIPKRYVQDVIRERAEEVYEALVRRAGKIYVCGSSGNMPKAVREAIGEVLGRYMETVEAEGFLVGMEKGGRYKQETW